MLGQTVRQGQFTLHIKVNAASWVPVEQLRVYLNGSVYHQQAIVRGQELTLPISTDADGFVIVEVTAAADELYRVVAPGFIPFAFSNPIFIDLADDNQAIH